MGVRFLGKKYETLRTMAALCDGLSILYRASYFDPHRNI